MNKTFGTHDLSNGIVYHDRLFMKWLAAMNTVKALSSVTFWTLTIFFYLK